MKFSCFFSIFFLLASGFAGAQVVDTAAVVKEVDSLLHKSLSFVGKGNFDAALKINALAAQIANDKLGSITVSNGNCLHIRGLILYNKGDYIQAKRSFMEAISIREKTRGKEHSDYLGSIINLAVVYKTIGNLKQSELLLLEAKETYEIRKKNFKHPFYINCLANLADVYTVLGEYEKSESLQLQVLGIRARELGKEHSEYAISLRNIGNLYINMGLYEKAEQFIIEAINVNEKVWGKEHYEYAASLFSLASLYITLDEFGKAEPLMLKAKTIWLSAYGEEHSRYAFLLNNLATLYLRMGNYKKSEVIMLQTKSIWAKSLGTDTPEYAQILNNLASLYLRSGEIKKSERMMAECVSVAKKTLGQEHPTYALYLSNQATIYSRMWLDDKAKQLYLKAINIWEKTLGKESLEYAEGLNGLAALNLNTSNFKEAETLYVESLSILERILGTDLEKYVTVQYEMAILYYEMGAYDKVVSIVQNVANKDRLAIFKGLKFLSEVELILYLNTFINRQCQSYSIAQNIKHNQVIETCFNNSLLYHGVSINTIFKVKQLAHKDSSSYASLQQLQAFQRNLATEYAKPITERDSIRITEWEEKSNTLEKELVRTVSGYGDLTRQVSWQEVQEKLHPGEVAVEFVSYRYYTPKPTDSTMYAALVLLPSDTAPRFIPLFEERQLQALLNRPGFDEQLAVKGLYGSRSELLNLLWKPLEPLLRDVKTVYYSPAGLLHRINPAALLDADKQPLSVGRQWVRVGSTRELVTGRLADRSFARAAEGHDAEALIIGGIRYDMDSLAFVAANPLDTGLQESFEIGSKDGKFRYMVEEGLPNQPTGLRGGGDDDWEPLPGTAREVEQMDILLQKAGFRTDVLTGYAASEERIKKIGKTGLSPRILHVATHGFAYPDPKKAPPKAFGGEEPTYKLQDDPMLRTGLVLAGANHYWKNKRPLTNREDGVLVAYEVRDLNLRNTELAVLSACQTGLGDVVGSEGVYGLQRAFRIAGAKFLIVSLWQVPDAQTQELMRLFYENWLDKQESLRDAFNNAQQTLREQEPNPYMWAGFVLIE